MNEYIITKLKEYIDNNYKDVLYNLQFNLYNKTDLIKITKKYSQILEKLNKIAKPDVEYFKLEYKDGEFIKEPLEGLELDHNKIVVIKLTHPLLGMPPIKILVFINIDYYK